VEFRILGPLEVVGADGPVTLHRGKEHALLAYMLLHANELLPSDVLVDALWDERAPATAPKILQNAVSQLRRALGDGRIETRAPGYVFHLQPDELDVDRFETLAHDGRYAEALALWRGPPLPELREERFADDTRRRLEEARLVVLENRIDADLDAGRHAELVPELEQLVTQHPLRERMHGQLMRALYAAGRQADALEAYRRARRTLNDELGLAPGPELQALERKILQQDPELAPQRPGAPSGRRTHRRWALPAVVLLLAVAAAIAAVVLLTRGGAKPVFATRNSLAVIDPQNERVEKVIAIGDTPRGVAVGRRYVWTANAGEGTVSQVDPQKLKLVRTIGLGTAATSLVESGGQVWVATGSDDTVERIDARSGGVLDTVELPSDFSSSAYAIAAGAGAVWVGSGNKLVKIDPTLGVVEGHRRIGGGIGGGVNGIVVLGSSVWVVASDESVTRISAVSLRQTARTGIGFVPSGVAAGPDSVWVGTPTVMRIDPLTARVTATSEVIPLRDYPPTLSIAYGNGYVWVASFDTGRVIRLDPNTEAVRSIRVGGHPSGIAVGHGKVWVTVS
jgi:DNA-binding SARP family transcriptional activator/DNA-binding beta-propeller fold protein YncE